MLWFVIILAIVSLVKLYFDYRAIEVDYHNDLKALEEKHRAEKKQADRELKYIKSLPARKKLLYFINRL